MISKSFSHKLYQEGNNVSNTRTMGSTQGSIPELPADSEFILTPQSPDILTNGALPEKYLTHSSKLIIYIYHKNLAA